MCQSLIRRHFDMHFQHLAPGRIAGDNFMRRQGQGVGMSACQQRIIRRARLIRHKMHLHLADTAEMLLKLCSNRLSDRGALPGSHLRRHLNIHVDMRGIHSASAARPQHMIDSGHLLHLFDDLFGSVGGGIHQHPPGLPQDFYGRTSNQHRHQQRRRHIRPIPAQQGHQRHADQHRQRNQHIRAGMRRIRQ